MCRYLSGEKGGAIRQRVEGMTPVGRVGQPTDIAGLAAFLCGPDAAFMTGAYLLMDGGLLDAQPVPEGDDARREEFTRLMQEAGERRKRQQPLIDER